MEWKDMTSYSRGDKERIPKILQLKARDITIKVHRIIHYEGWYLTCHDLRIRDYYLGDISLGTAKLIAKNRIENRINELIKVKQELKSNINE